MPPPLKYPCTRIVNKEKGPESVTNTRKGGAYYGFSGSEESALR